MIILHRSSLGLARLGGGDRHVGSRIVFGTWAGLLVLLGLGFRLVERGSSFGVRFVFRLEIFGAKVLRVFSRE